MPSTYLSIKTFLERDQYLRSLLPHGDQAIAGQIEKHVLKPIYACDPYDLYGDQA